MSKRISSGIRVDKLDQLVKDLGVRVKLYKSTLCPNMKSLETLDHSINCKVCNNNMIDFDPKCTVAMMQQQDLVEQFKIQGTFFLDEVMATFLSGVTLSRFSKIELLDFKEDFYELVQRQEDDIDRLKYPVCEITAVFTTTDTVIKRYNYEIDYVISSSGDIQWVSLNRPAEKQVYSVYYKYHPTYRAIKAVHRDRFSQDNVRPELIQAPKVQPGDQRTYVKMPEQWVLKRDYLLERRDSQGNMLSKNVYFDPAES